MAHYSAFAVSCVKAVHQRFRRTSHESCGRNLGEARASSVNLLLQHATGQDSWLFDLLQHQAHSLIRIEIGRLEMDDVKGDYTLALLGA